MPSIATERHGARILVPSSIIGVAILRRRRVEVHGTTGRTWYERPVR